MKTPRMKRYNNILNIASPSCRSINVFRMVLSIHPVYVCNAIQCREVMCQLWRGRTVASDLSQRTGWSTSQQQPSTVVPYCSLSTRKRRQSPILSPGISATSRWTSTASSTRKKIHREPSKHLFIKWAALYWMIRRKPDFCKVYIIALTCVCFWCLEGLYLIWKLWNRPPSLLLCSILLVIALLDNTSTIM